MGFQVWLLNGIPSLAININDTFKFLPKHAKLKSKISNFKKLFFGLVFVLYFMKLPDGKLKLKTEVHYTMCLQVFGATIARNSIVSNNSCAVR